jgi:uncharacterized pyridoxal phosphate-containing UPF0001 family protein
MSAGRDPAAVTLVAVSKAKPAELMREVATAGVTDFGESYLQEALPKLDELADQPIAVAFHRRTAVEQDARRGGTVPVGAQRRPPQCGSQIVGAKALPRPALEPVHPGGADTGADQGRRPARRPPGARAGIQALPRVKLRGLMCVPPPQPDTAAERAVFAGLRHLLERLNEAGHALDVLSMGMSGDFESAIAEGATHVRIGTALFGNR